MTEATAVLESIAQKLYAQGTYCGTCAYEGWGTCDTCRRVAMRYAGVAYEVITEDLTTILQALPAAVVADGNVSLMALTVAHELRVRAELTHDTDMAAFLVHQASRLTA